MHAGMPVIPKTQQVSKQHNDGIITHMIDDMVDGVMHD